jgi:hypothetical protein
VYHTINRNLLKWPCDKYFRDQTGGLQANAPHIKRVDEQVLPTIKTPQHLPLRNADRIPLEQLHQARNRGLTLVVLRRHEPP